MSPPPETGENIPRNRGKYGKSSETGENKSSETGEGRVAVGRVPVATDLIYFPRFLEGVTFPAETVIKAMPSSPSYSSR